MTHQPRHERIAAVVPAGFAAVVVAAYVLTRIMGGFGDDWRPDHFDEWRNLSLAQRFVESGVLAAEEPIGSPNGLARDISDRNRSLGIAALYAGWLVSAPLPIAHFKVLVLAFLLLYLVGMASLLRSLDVRLWAILPALLAIGALPTDAMLLGPAIAAPSTLSLGLLCFALVAHLGIARHAASPSAVRTRPRVTGWWVLLIVTAGLLASIYPLTLIVFGVLVAVDVLARPQLLRSVYARSMAITAGLGSLLLFANEWQTDLASTASHLANLFVLDQIWHHENLHVYRLDYLVLPPILVLALFGTGAVLAGEAPESASDSGRPRAWLAAAFLGPLLAYAGYHLFGVGLVLPYQRIGLYLNFGAILVSAVAVEHLLGAIEARRKGWWARGVGVGVISLAIVFSPRADPPYEGEKSVIRPRPALEAAAHRIARDYSPPSRIFSSPLDGLFLEALTGLRVAPESLDALLSGTPPPILDCAAGFEIVVGKNSCPNYVLAFRVDDVLVYAKRAGSAAADVRGRE